MKKTLNILVFLLFTVPAYTAFEDIGRDARAKGMANAFYGEPAGVSSIYYNPAGTAYTKKIEFLATFGMPYLGFDAVKFNTFNGALIIPFPYVLKSEIFFKDAVIGFGMNNLGLLYENSTYDDDDNIDYYERLFVINYAKDLLDVLGRATRLSIGLNFDIYSRGLAANMDTEANSSYFKNGLTTGGFGMDLGFMFFLNYNMILGVVIDHIVEPNVAFNKDIIDDPIERNVKLGLSWKSDKLWIFRFPTIAGGIAFEDLKSNVWEYRLGFEFWTFSRILGIRLGYELSDEGMNNGCVGLSGVKAFQSGHEIEINYSFVMPITTIRATYGTHTFSLVYKYSLSWNWYEFDQKKRQQMITKQEEEKRK
ncbi:MAG: hypothetical protein PHF84_12590, partial [bacterium]|nr:hypothetical protein [bacterium]